MLTILGGSVYGVVTSSSLDTPLLVFAIVDGLGLGLFSSALAIHLDNKDKALLPNPKLEEPREPGLKQPEPAQPKAPIPASELRAEAKPTAAARPPTLQMPAIPPALPTFVATSRIDNGILRLFLKNTTVSKVEAMIKKRVFYCTITTPKGLEITAQAQDLQDNPKFDINDLTSTFTRRVNRTVIIVGEDNCSFYEAIYPDDFTGAPRFLEQGKYLQSWHDGKSVIADGDIWA